MFFETHTPIIFRSVKNNKVVTIALTKFKTQNKHGSFMIARDSYIETQNDLESTGQIELKINFKKPVNFLMFSDL